MFRGILLGDLWGIQEGVWVQLWSGTVGAIVSAGVAALVAVLVLTRSNAHQQKLAAEGMARQKELAEHQLAEQREEAGRVRERAALSEVVFATEWLFVVIDAPTDEIDRHFPVLLAAMARWRIELGLGPMQQVVAKLSGLLMLVASDKAAAERAGMGDAAAAAKQQLLEAVGELTAVALEWPGSNVEQRAALQVRLVEMRELLMAFRTDAFRTDTSDSSANG